MLICNNPVFFPQITKIKIHSSFFISNEKITVSLMGQCILWAGKYGNYTPHDTVSHSKGLNPSATNWSSLKVTVFSVKQYVNF